MEILCMLLVMSITCGSYSGKKYIILLKLKWRENSFHEDNNFHKKGCDKYSSTTPYLLVSVLVELK